MDGPLITNYTVSNLQPSSAAIPGYTPKGTLYQADVTARSDGGIVTPMVNDFIARGPNGQNYRVIDKVGPRVASTRRRSRRATSRPARCTST